MDVLAVAAAWNRIHVVSSTAALQNDLRKSWVLIQSVRPHVCIHVELHGDQQWGIGYAAVDMVRGGALPDFQSIVARTT